jgi:hypothetical protein
MKFFADKKFKWVNINIELRNRHIYKQNISKDRI